MKKRMFFGFAFFVMLAMMVAWKFAAAELADLQRDADNTIKKKNTELVSVQTHTPLFI